MSGGLKGWIPAALWNTLRELSSAARLEDAVAAALSGVFCVDVGASYYAHPAWKILRKSAATRWVAVEPNKANLGYTQPWEWPCELSVVTTGLSEQGGRQTLHVTNVDSGSSLLEPVIAESQKHRFPNPGYFFPVMPRQIDTLTLLDVVPQELRSLPGFIKLDTQGTELSILRGGHSLLESRAVIGVELESTMLAQPFMLGSGKFWEAAQYLESLGFELIHLKPIEMGSVLGNDKPRGRHVLNECDAVFALRVDVLADMAVGHRMAMIAFYCAYRLYEEAIALIDRDAQVRSLLDARAPGASVVRALLLKVA